MDYFKRFDESKRPQVPHRIEDPLANPRGRHEQGRRLPVKRPARKPPGNGRTISGERFAEDVMEARFLLFDHGWIEHPESYRQRKGKQWKPERQAKADHPEEIPQI